MSHLDVGKKRCGRVLVPMVAIIAMAAMVAMSAMIVIMVVIATIAMTAATTMMTTTMMAITAMILVSVAMSAMAAISAGFAGVLWGVQHDLGTGGSNELGRPKLRETVPSGWQAHCDPDPFSSVQCLRSRPRLGSKRARTPGTSHGVSRTALRPKCA